MAIARPSRQQILNRIYNKILNQTTITANLQSSVIGVILNIIAAEMDDVWAYVEDRDQQNNLSTATGADLDNWGYLIGVPRIQPNQASTVGYTPSVQFTNLGSLSLVIPAGTRVYKSSNVQVAYFTTVGLTLNPGQSGTATVTAANTGESYNVGIGDLNTCNLPSASVSVTNLLPIGGGTSLESDDSYRYRILQDLRRRNVLNLDNLGALLKSVPGVQDVYILNKYRGAGTFDAVIIPYNQNNVSAIINQCQSLVAEYVPVGISSLIRPPNYRQLDIQVNLVFAPNTTTQETTRQSVRDQLQARINNLPIEDGTGIGSFNTATVQSVALNADVSIKDAVVVLGLDGSPIASAGKLTLNVGDRLVIRTLSVQ